VCQSSREPALNVSTEVAASADTPQSTLNPGVSPLARKSVPSGESVGASFDTPYALRRGLSLVEILLVVAVMGILAAGIVTYSAPNLADELSNGAEIVLSDVERARNLAVSNNSKYKLTFNSDGTGYYLQHSGTNTSLNTLPSWPYKQRTDSSDRNTTLLAKLPGLDDVALHAAVQITSNQRQAVTDLEFSSLGNTVRTTVTEIWLSAGQGSAKRYLPITINPTTGLATIGAVTGTAPTIVN
jgi:prepilin-type N-terminal cleavage/methylation domain-containing protein